MTSLISYFRHRYDKFKGDAIHSHPKESEIRQRLKKELYEYSQTLNHGFPTKPSVMAYDPKLKLLAIGTKSGALRIFGTPGVEFTASHESGEAITLLTFIPDEGRLVSLTVDNVLHLWEINSDDFTSTLEEKKKFEDFSSDGSKTKTISSMCVLDNSLLLGTEGGNVYLLNLKTFTLSEQHILLETIMQNVPDDFKVNPGAVEALEPHPTVSSQFLIGYDRGLIVLWDAVANDAKHTFNSTQQLEALTWNANGEDFISAHTDGSYITWSTEDASKPKEQANTPYGPFPCKAITRIAWKTVSGDNEPFLIFAGGMARGMYGDKFTVSVIQGETHVTFDFTSRVLDFCVLCSRDELHTPAEESESRVDSPHTLIVLLEEELVAVDLLTNGWPSFRLPYLNSIHASAITASSHVANIPENLWKKIIDAGNSLSSNFSRRTWPVSGGQRQEVHSTRDLLLTGHEDGSVRFWDVSSTSMSLLYKLNTAGFFEEGFQEHAADEEDEWPPFRKIGHFDPYSDDPRLGIQKMHLCPVSDILVVAGTAGQVVVLQMEREHREQDIKVSKVHLDEGRDNFKWKGHDALTVMSGEIRYGPGFQPQCVLQVHPPAACTALAVHTEWQMLSVGTAHGFCLFDFCQRRAISATCTLDASETTATDDSTMSRRKSFKKSLRESFRRLRRRRSMGKSKRVEAGSKTANRLQEIKAEEGRSTAAPRSPGRKLPASSIEEDLPPNERQVEERGAGGDSAAQSSMVRCLHFADTYLTATVHSASLLAATNAGKVFIFSITLPANDKRDQEDVTARINKEITLRHQAPVVGLCVIDSTYYPLPPALEVQNGRAKAPDMNANHRLLVISEEQFKIFSLPALKPEDKWKLTAHEGSRTRRVATCTFRSRSDEQYNEMDIACITNLGQLSVYTIKGLRRQMNIDAINKTDINGISSCTFTSSGEGFYLVSSSEYARFSLSASRAVRPLCKLTLKDGLRTPEGTPQIIVENYDETHPPNGQSSPDVTSVDQSFRSMDMTQDDVTEYVHDQPNTSEDVANTTQPPAAGDPPAATDVMAAPAPVANSHQSLSQQPETAAADQTSGAADAPASNNIRLSLSESAS